MPYFIYIRETDSDPWTYSPEGPWPTQELAEDFANAEVGTLWKIERETMKTFRTTDGYTLHRVDSAWVRTADGNAETVMSPAWVDSLDPATVDLTLADSEGYPVDDSGERLEGDFMTAECTHCGAWIPLCNEGICGCEPEEAAMLATGRCINCGRRLNESGECTVCNFLKF